MELGTGLLATGLGVSVLTLGACYLVALTSSALWQKLRPTSKSPRVWVVALVLWGWLGGGVLFVLDPTAPATQGSAFAPAPTPTAIPGIVSPDSP
jgi:hypothetical protein